MIRLNYIRKHFPMKPITVKESSGKKGYHVIVYNLGISRKQAFRLREKFWDDPIRLHIDRKRENKGVPLDILFTSKKGKHGRKYTA